MQLKKMPAQADHLASVQDIAKLLKCSVFTVYELTRAGVIPHVKVGSRLIRFDLAKVHEWIAAGGATQKIRA